MAAFSNATLLKQISQQIKVLDLQSLSTSCLDKTCSNLAIDSTASEDENEANTEDSEEETLNVLIKTFDEDSPLEINKIRHGNVPTTRNFYTKPTPPDLQCEERGTFVTNCFDGNPFTHGMSTEN